MFQDGKKTDTFAQIWQLVHPTHPTQSGGVDSCGSQDFNRKWLAVAHLWWEPGCISLLLSITTFSCGHLAYLLMLWALYNMLFETIPECRQACPPAFWKSKHSLDVFGRKQHAASCCIFCLLVGWVAHASQGVSTMLAHRSSLISELKKSSCADWHRYGYGPWIKTCWKFGGEEHPIYINYQFCFGVY